MKSGRKLQMIKSRSLADHVPSALSFHRGVYMAAARTAPTIDRDALVRCVLYGKGRHHFIKEVEACAHAVSGIWQEALDRNSPSQQYLIMSAIMHDAMKTCFGKRNDDCEELKAQKKERAELLKARRCKMMELWVEQSKTLRTWHESVRRAGGCVRLQARVQAGLGAVGAPTHTLLCKVIERWSVVAKIGRLDRKIKDASKNAFKQRLQLLEVELDLALERGDSAVSWRLVRQIANAVKGSRRQFAGAPKANPNVDEVVGRYSKPANQGGWGAQVFSLDQVDALEPDFSDVSVVVDDKNV